MALYEFNANRKRLTPISKTTFDQEKIQERKDLQPLFKSDPEILFPDILIVAEEFCCWTESQLRIDLLGIDKDSNFVVFELKRTEDAAYAELQAIRYAAMISTMTFDDLIGIYDQYLKDNNDKKDAKSHLLDFLNWEESDDTSFGQKTRIVIASAGFSKELTTSVLWLNEQGLDIRCVRMRPYKSNSQVLLDVQTIIPLPETEEYQIRIQHKKHKEQESRERAKRDLTKYDLTINGKSVGTNLNKRKLIWRVVSEIIKSGVSPEQVKELCPLKFRIFEGKLDARQVEEKFEQEDARGKVRRSDRFFCKEGELFHTDDGNATYVLSNQWGTNTIPTLMELREKFQGLKIDFKPANSE